MGLCLYTTRNLLKYNFRKGMNEGYSIIGFRLTTSLLTVIVMMFVGNAIFNQEMFAHRFSSLGYPPYIVYPLVAAKVLGMITIWSSRSGKLKEWAYAGFFFNFALAFFAELQAPDGELFSSSIALVCLGVSYYCGSNSIKLSSVETSSVAREL
jgi:hypothetical protein